MTIQCCGVRLRTTCCSRLRRFLLSFTRYGDSFPRTRLLHHNWSCGWRGEQTSIDSYFHALSISDRYFPDAALVGAHQSLGEAVGKLYVERHFPPASKRQMEELVENLRTALGERIE